MLNFDFIILSTDEEEIEKLTRNKMEYILKYCGTIYDWNTSNIDMVIKNKLKNTHEGDEFEIVDNIYEFYEDICEEYLGNMF